MEGDKKFIMLKLLNGISYSNDCLMPEIRFTIFADWITEFGKAVRTDNWRPFFVKTETIIAGNAATALVALVFSILTGSTLGIIGYGLLMAVTDTLIDETPVEKANKFWGI